MLGVGRTYVRTCIVPGGVVVLLRCVLSIFLSTYISISLYRSDITNTHTPTPRCWQPGRFCRLVPVKK